MCFVILGISSLVPVMLYPYCIFLQRQAVLEQESKLGMKHECTMSDGAGATETIQGVIDIEKGGSESLCEVGDVEDTEHIGTPGEKGKLLPLPMGIRLLVVTFFVFYVGSESGYGGWISSYLLRRGVVRDKAKAAFVASVYWGGLTAGRLLAIPIAVFIST